MGDEYVCLSDRRLAYSIDRNRETNTNPRNNLFLRNAALDNLYLSNRHVDDSVK